MDIKHHRVVASVLGQAQLARNAAENFLMIADIRLQCHMRLGGLHHLPQLDRIHRAVKLGGEAHRHHLLHDLFQVFHFNACHFSCPPRLFFGF